MTDSAQADENWKPNTIANISSTTDSEEDIANYIAYQNLYQDANKHAAA